MTIRNLEKAFRPASVALIGASNQPKSIGLTVARNLKTGGFHGPIWFVNPKYSAIDGDRCWPNVAALPAAPDLAVIITPPATVPGIIAELGERGTRAAVVITAGITRENGLRQAMLDAAKPHLLRIIGPNCLGIFAPDFGLNASFAHIAAPKGRLAFLSQSGALIGAVLDWAQERRIGFSHVVSMGDMADVDVGDMLDYLAGDIGTSAILLYLETIINPRKFMSAARSAARAKPVVVVKGGRHEAGARAAATHTGALAVSDEVASVAFQRSGLLRVRDLEELFDAAETLSRLRPIEGERLAILTNGGGAGVLAVDELSERGGVLATLSPATMAALDAILPPTWSRANPVDIIGDAGPERYAGALDALLEDDGVDAILVMNCPTALASSMEAAEAVLATLARRRTGGKPLKPIFVNWLGDASTRAPRAEFAAAGVPSYDTPAHAVRGFLNLRDYSRLQRLLMRTPPGLPEGFETRPDVARGVLKEAASAGRALLTEPEAKDVLAAYGIPVVSTLTAASPEEVERMSASMLADTGAIVVKILSDDISHKSDVGGVALNLSTPADARAAAERMLRRAAQVRPDARIRGFTVQPMISRPRAHELIAGVADDPTFGPVLVFGAGGTAVEVIKDKALMLPPLDLQLARDLMERTRVFNLLKGYRDRAAADLEGLALTLVRLSHLVNDLPMVRELDINPLLADDKGVIALDARVKIDPAAAETIGPNPRFSIRAYPKQWEAPARTLDGREILIRPVMPSDEPAYAAFLQKVAASDLRLRFFAPKKEFSHAFVARLTQIDYARAMAFIAIAPETGEIIGASRLISDSDYVRAEYAVLVRSDLKGQGIGWLLMQRLIDYARAEGLKELFGDVLAENTAMLKMCRELGFSVQPESEDPSIYKVRLAL